MVSFADFDEEAVRAGNCFTMSTQKCELPPNATFIEGGFCLGGGIVAQLYMLPKPSGGLTYHIQCETISKVVLGNFPIDHCLPDLRTITPTASIEFFPEQSWYCVSLSLFNLPLNISVHKLDMNGKTLTELRLSTFDRNDLDPMGLFVTHQASPADKPRKPLASFWMTKTHLFCLSCSAPGYIRLLGCNKTDLKFQILSYPGYSQRTGAYRLKLNQELLCSSNEGGKISLITVRPIEEHVNLRGVYEIRQLTFKF